MDNTFTMHIGDRSNDGHGRCQLYQVTANGSFLEIGQAFNKLKTFGLDFSKICKNYGEDAVNKSVIDLLEKLGVDEEELTYLHKFEGHIDGPDHFCALIIKCLNLIEPSLQMKVMSEPESIGSFGYGLFE